MGCCASVKASKPSNIQTREHIVQKPPPAVEEIKANDQLVARMR